MFNMTLSNLLITYVCMFAGVPKLKKDGQASKIKVLPELTALQTDAKYRDKWIEYSAKDAIATWYLRLELEKKLKNMPWLVLKGASSTDTVSHQSSPHQQQDEDILTRDFKRMGTMYDFYLKYFKDFGELLTSMERNGIRVDTQTHLKQAEERAKLDKIEKEQIFMKWY